MSYEIIRVHSSVPLTWTPAKKCWETIAWWEFRIVFPGWTLSEIHALTFHAAVGVKLRTALSRTFPSWLLQLGAPHLTFQNCNLFHVSHETMDTSFLSATLAGGAKACRRHSQVLEADSEMQQEFYKFTWSTKWFSLNLPSLPGFLGSCPVCFSCSSRE